MFGSSNSNIWIILLSSDIETKFGTWNWFQISKTPFLKILVVKFGMIFEFSEFLDPAPRFINYPLQSVTKIWLQTPEQKRLTVRCRVYKDFSLGFFLHWEYQTHPMHFHTIEKDPVQISSKPRLMVKCRSFLHILKTRKINY